MTLTERSQQLAQWSITEIDRLSSTIDLVIRLSIASSFLKAGMTKIANWESTLYLFEYEYAVPLIPTEAAAVLGAGVEIVMSVLLAIGLGTRFSALVLFIFNIIAAVSFPALSDIGVRDHQYWGLLLLVPLVHGPGALSADYFIRKRCWRS